MNYIEVNKMDTQAINALSELATKIVKEHYDPIIGAAQNNYMIAKFQSAESIVHQLNQNYNYFFVTNSDGINVGFLAYYLRDKDLSLSKFYLAKNQRGKGISKNMLRFIINKAKQTQVSLITLNVNKYNHVAIRAYEQLGFVKISEEKINIGNGYYMDDFVYQYKIKPIK